MIPRAPVCSPSRRDFLATALAAAAAASSGAPAEAFGSLGLGEAAATHKRFFGSAVRIDKINSDHDFRSVVLNECSTITPEIELKWAAIEPQYGVLDFAAIDDLTNFAVKNGKSVRGHTLLWHESVPAWCDQMLRDKPDWSLVRRYFGSVMPRYGDAIEQWDVVNEPIDTGHRMDGLRENVFLTAFGTEYIGRALLEARSFSPKGQLMINEYGLEYDNADEHDRRYLLLKLLERLKTSGAPIDGLGLQAHLDLRKGTVSEQSIAQFVREVNDLGLFIEVTELDVKEADYAASPAARDRSVADEIKRYLGVVLSEGDVRGVATWGLSDRYSWLDVTSEDYARFPGAWSNGGGPGLNRGLPLDSSLQPKPMYYSLRNALKG